MPSLELLDSPEASSSKQPLPSLNLKSDGRAPAGAARPGSRLQELLVHPTPGFVVKTLLDTALTVPSMPAKTKIFLNVSSASEVPVPTEVEAEKGMIHCVVSDIRETADKTGNLSLVVDTILPTTTLQKAKRDKNFKQWLIQVVLEKVEERYGVELNRNYGEPNIKAKGEVLPRRAVLPVYDATGSGQPKIVEVAGVAPTAAQAAPAQHPSAKGKERMRPRQTFDIIDHAEAGPRRGFVMHVEMPEEDMNADTVAKSLELHATASRLSVRTPHYELDTDLPVDIDVASLSQRGGTEWNTTSRTLRLCGRIAG